MNEIFDIAGQNILSPIILFFMLGVLAGYIKSDLEIPTILAKSLALYLVASIGLQGGIKIAAYDLNAHIISLFIVVIIACAIMPFIGYGLLRATKSLDPLNAAALCAHYGSVSLVTFIACTEFLGHSGLVYAGYMVALLAFMETPAILGGLFLARDTRGAPKQQSTSLILREVLLNGTVVLLIGAMMIGYFADKTEIASVTNFFVDPFKGVLCFFLLDMGLLIGRKSSVVKQISLRLLSFGIYMPIIGAGIGLLISKAFGLALAETTILMTLFASASYIAVPAAIKLALPKADPAIYVTLPLGITFPFNIIVGIPVYYAVAKTLGIS